MSSIFDNIWIWVSTIFAAALISVVAIGFTTQRSLKRMGEVARDILHGSEAEAREVRIESKAKISAIYHPGAYCATFRRRVTNDELLNDTVDIHNRKIKESFWRLKEEIESVGIAPDDFYSFEVQDREGDIFVVVKIKVRDASQEKVVAECGNKAGFIEDRDARLSYPASYADSDASEAAIKAILNEVNFIREKLGIDSENMEMTEVYVEIDGLATTGANLIHRTVRTVWTRNR